MATPALTGLVPGAYTITESLPPVSDAGRWTLTAVVCNGEPVTLAGATVTVTLANDVATNCTFTNTLAPPGTLTVVKQIDDPAKVRTGPVLIEVSCTDGQKAMLTVPVGASSGALAAPLLFNVAATCTATETATGAPAGATVSTTVTVTIDGAGAGGMRAPKQAPSAIAPVAPGTAVAMQFTDTYKAAPPPPTPPTTPPAPAPPTAPAPPRLPVTGANVGYPLVVGAVLLVLGGLLVIGARRRGH